MTIDPVADANAYRELMFQLAGEGDPSERMALAPGTVRGLVMHAGDDLRKRPAEGEWSVIELLGHMVDAELIVWARLRWIMAEDQPPIAGYDQDDWVRAQRYNDADPEPLLQVLEAVRPTTVALYASTTPEDRERVGIHSERGPESFDTVYRMLAGHDIFHLQQMQKTLELVRSGYRP
jgi:hypothetical protein